MLVKEVMKKNTITVKLGTGYREVARILLENGISGAPVVDAGGNLAGIVSEKDLFRALYPTYGYFYTSPQEFVDFEKLEREAKRAREKKVEECMSLRLITTTADTSVLKVGALMVATGIHRVPVVDDQGRLTGIVTRGDIYRAIMAEHFEISENKRKKKTCSVKK